MNAWTRMTAGWKGWIMTVAVMLAVAAASETVLLVLTMGLWLLTAGGCGVLFLELRRIMRTLRRLGYMTDDGDELLYLIPSREEWEVAPAGDPPEGSQGVLKGRSARTPEGPLPVRRWDCPGLRPVRDGWLLFWRATPAGGGSAGVRVPAAE